LIIMWYACYVITLMATKLGICTACTRQDSGKKGEVTE
jgi:hypothetical protein